MDAINKCRICGSEDSHPIYNVQEMMYGTRENFPYFQCKSCCCLQIEKIPDNIHQFYPDDYYSFNPINRKNKSNMLHYWLQKMRCGSALWGRGVKLNKLLSYFVSLPSAIYKTNGGISTGGVLKKSYVKNFSARFLDVGCGACSNWLEDLDEIGFTHLTGVDPFIAGDARRNNVTILKRELTDIKGKFDFITFHHSLEHIPDQFGALCEARRLMSDNSTCLVRIPIVSSLVWDRYGVNWVELDAPRHFYLHSVESISLVARNAGLELYDIVFDALPFEFAGSEQYMRGIPLNDRRSIWKDSTLFSDGELASFASMAAEANRRGVGGRAGFYFRPF